MIKLGKLTDYAVVLLLQLSQEGPGVSRSAHQLATATGLTEPTAAKVLKKLSGSGLLESVRGVAGGYRLLRSSADVSICEVIEAMEGPITLTSCVTGVADSCKTERTCPARGKWTPVNNALRAALQAVTLADMAQTEAVPPSKLIQIAGAQHVSHK